MTTFERDVRAAVYRHFLDTGGAPSPEDLAVGLHASVDTVRSALQTLADDHALVLLPDGESIRMAHPFSGVATDSVVTIGDRTWFANCVWDGFAIVGLLGGTGRVSTHSPATGAPIVFEVADHAVHGEAIAHFLVPAAHFWDDIGYT
jgi:Alkylmercury lyase